MKKIWFSWTEGMDAKAWARLMTKEEALAQLRAVHPQAAEFIPKKFSSFRVEILKENGEGSRVLVWGDAEPGAESNVYEEGLRVFVNGSVVFDDVVETDGDGESD